MTQQTLSQPYYCSDRLHGHSELLKETKILFNHQGSDAELVQQIAIAVQAINTLNPKP
ncbi:MAG: hypothetical protein KME11_07235 [Timaviella obliquedivisa GSE-PSE-MK23-08B]|jgi:hypothetical protein|nr:hypothetical protein [Timaviella obliquedivisa GSE-PSE-MK23-08B]